MESSELSKSTTEQKKQPISNQTMHSYTTYTKINHNIEFPALEISYDEFDKLGDMIKSKGWEIKNSTNEKALEFVLSLNTSESWQCVQDWIAEVETAIKAYLREIRPEMEF